jgi:hypothetical protein
MCTLSALQNSRYFLVELTSEFRVISEVSVFYTQHVDFSDSSLKVGLNVLAVERLHDNDNVGPIDKPLRQWIAARVRHDSR